MQHTETGTLRAHPFARAGTGTDPLVVVPGFEDSMWSGRFPPGSGWWLGWYFARLLSGRSIYLIGRPRGLPTDSTIEDMAAGYEAVLSADLGRADVLGISMGGMIAQSLGARRPDLVGRLVLANTGPRIANGGSLDRYRAYARARDWPAIRADLAGRMFGDWRAVAYPLLALTAARPFQPRPAEPADVETSLDAIEAFDSADWLDEIDCPTLVFGGTDDPFFPAGPTRELAASIDGAELDLVQGGRHAAFHERKARFDRRVAGFLARTAPRGPRPLD